MWCGRKGIDCPYSGEFGECHRSACCNTTTEKSMDDIKRGAVKEFAEKLKEKLLSVYGKIHFIELDTVDITYFIVYVQFLIDELLKEYEK